MSILTRKTTQESVGTKMTDRPKTPDEIKRDELLAQVDELNKRIHKDKIAPVRAMAEAALLDVEAIIQEVDVLPDGNSLYDTRTYHTSTGLVISCRASHWSRKDNALRSLSEARNELEAALSTIQDWQVYG